MTVATELLRIYSLKGEGFELSLSLNVEGVGLSYLD